MEQMYLIEIFIDKITIFATEDDESSANKNLITKVKFGPKIQFIVKEGQLAVNDDKKDDIIECDESGRRQWTRTIRVGKSYLFPSYPDTVLMILSKFPLEIEVWNDDENEVNIFVGVGNMHWDTHFFHMLKETADACKIHEPLAIKNKTTLWAECCCKPAGEIHFILRLSALGDSIITEYQQLLKDPDSFVFRTNKAPSMFQCKRVEGDDPNFCMVGSLYETTTLEDPDILDAAQKKIQICTELQSCGLGAKSGPYVCDHTKEGTEPPRKKYPIDKIRMGDITGPCGNPNCALAHKVRTYIRNLETYKGKAAASGITETKPGNRKVCGMCDCKDDRWHRDECPTKKDAKAKCEGCGGITKAGDTCEDRKVRLYDIGATPKGSPTQVTQSSKGSPTDGTQATLKSSTKDTQVTYVISVPKFLDDRNSMFRRDYIVEDCFNTSYSSRVNITKSISNPTVGCSCRSPEPSQCTSTSQENKVMVYNVGTNNPMVFNADNLVGTSTGTNNPITYNVGTNLAYSTEPKDTRRKQVQQGQQVQQVYNVTEILDEKDCRCNPPKPSPPCRTFDCDCMAEIENIRARKTHRPYCPSYQHKENCPVTMMHEEEEQKKLEEEEDETAPLPYGLPPIQLGPCPVLGRPCTVPDGFARMYKNAVLPTQPPSFSDAGKVCCSKEYHRIKKAIKEYMKYEKDNDFRCINKFNVDTEKRCCDKEQMLMSLMGKGCCGSHKLAIQEKFKDKENKPQ